MPMGIEIEVENLDIESDAYKALYLGHVPPEHGWEPKGDGSLDDGTEFVSGVFVHEHEAFDSAAAVHRGAVKVGGSPGHRRASVHIHLSPPEGVDMASWVVQFARIVVKWDADLASRFTSEKRRQKWAQRYAPSIALLAGCDPSTLTVRDIIANYLSHGSRYYGANFLAINVHGTIELRYFDGAKTAEDLATYIEVARTLNHHAAMGTMPTAAELFIAEKTAQSQVWPEFDVSPRDKAIAELEAMGGKRLFQMACLAVLRWMSTDTDDMSPADALHVRRYLAYCEVVNRIASEKFAAHEIYLEYNSRWRNARCGSSEEAHWQDLRLESRIRCLKLESELDRAHSKLGFYGGITLDVGTVLSFLEEKYGVVIE